MNNLEEVLKSKNGNSIISYAITAKSEDKKKLERAIVATDDAFYIYLFAKRVPGADVELLLKAIMEIGNDFYISMFEKKILKTNKKSSLNDIKPTDADCSIIEEDENDIPQLDFKIGTPSPKIKKLLN